MCFGCFNVFQLFQVFWVVYPFLLSQILLFIATCISFFVHHSCPHKGTWPELPLPTSHTQYSLFCPHVVLSHCTHPRNIKVLFPHDPDHPANTTVMNVVWNEVFRNLKLWFVPYLLPLYYLKRIWQQNLDDCARGTTIGGKPLQQNPHDCAKDTTVGKKGKQYKALHFKNSTEPGHRKITLSLVIKKLHDCAEGTTVGWNTLVLDRLTKPCPHLNQWQTAHVDTDNNEEQCCCPRAQTPPPVSANEAYPHPFHSRSLN